jgi:KDO2-lipid IV(A) lauroyltransferase
VLFAQCRRRARGYYEVEFREVAKPPYRRGEQRITARFVELAEAAIRSEPQSWLWSNRRWKRHPPA